MALNPRAPSESENFAGIGKRKGPVHNNDPEPKNAFLGPKKLEIFSTKKN